jgi:hypothetical protein
MYIHECHDSGLQLFKVAQISKLKRDRSLVDSLLHSLPSPGMPEGVPGLRMRAELAPAPPGSRQGLGFRV